MAIHHSEEQIRLSTPIYKVVRFDAATPVAPRYLYSWRKRILDLLVGSVGVLVLAIVLPFVAIAIKLNS
jgi:lipopolysaccharide/colanic/teichoic acid biosynthesis glycosyltransferase